MVLYKYTSYGEVEGIVNNQLNDYRIQIANILKEYNGFVYKGYYYDIETSLFWLSSRYYSPELCRFISPDEVSYLDPESVNGLNLYCYCLNNPISYCDPSGHWIETVFDLISLGASVVEVVINPLDPWAWAGLVGDAVDLLPFVTGVGESTRAAKLVKYADYAAEHADELADITVDTIKFVKASDMKYAFKNGGDFLDVVGNSSNYKAFTVSNHVDGTKLHTMFMKNGKTIANTRKRVDGINEITKSIFELKPYNVHSARRGVKQIINYNDLLGGGFKMIIVLY